jgi:hypothetical protein
MADRDLQGLFDASAARPEPRESERLLATAEALDDSAVVARAFHNTADVPDELARRRLLAAAERAATGARQVRRQARLAMVAVVAVALGGGIVARWLADGPREVEAIVAPMAVPVAQERGRASRNALDGHRSGERQLIEAMPLAGLASTLAGDDPWLGEVAEPGTLPMDPQPAQANEATLAALSLSGLDGDSYEFDPLAAMP